MTISQTMAKLQKILAAYTTLSSESYKYHNSADQHPEEGQLFAAQVLKVTVLTVYYRNIVNIATAMCITLITRITLIILITLKRSLYIIGP